jgi:hypothetical protein
LRTASSAWHLASAPHVKIYQNICKKINQKYEYVVHVIIYHHAKLELQQVVAQGKVKKERISVNYCAVVTVHLKPAK